MKCKSPCTSSRRRTESFPNLGQVTGRRSSGRWSAWQLGVDLPVSGLAVGRRSFESAAVEHPDLTALVAPLATGKWPGLTPSVRMPLLDESRHEAGTPATSRNASLGNFAVGKAHDIPRVSLDPWAIGTLGSAVAHRRAVHTARVVAAKLSQGVIATFQERVSAIKDYIAKAESCCDVRRVAAAGWECREADFMAKALGLQLTESRHGVLAGPKVVSYGKGRYFLRASARSPFYI